MFFYDAPGNFIRSQLFYSDSLKEINLNQEILNFAHSLLNSSLFYFWSSVYFFGRTGYALKSNEILDFPISNAKQFNQNLKLLSEQIDLVYKRIISIENEYQPKKKFLRNAKPIIDDIDKVLAEHYGFSQSELDFIINYDIKYRMGKELEEEE